METHVGGRYIVGLKISEMLRYCRTMYMVAFSVRHLCILHWKAKMGKKGKERTRGVI